MGIISQLDVVNEMLGLLGETGVNTLLDGSPLVITGLSRLRAANAREQTRGWWFNTETVTLAQTEDGSVYLPDTTLKIDPTDTSLNYTQRGNRLYNLRATPGVTSPYFIGTDVQVTLVNLVPFDDLPAAAQMLVSFGAQLSFVADHDADEAKVRRIEQAYRDALIEMRSEHTRCVDPNMLRNPSFLATFGGIHGARLGRIINA